MKALEKRFAVAGTVVALVAALGACGGGDDAEQDVKDLVTKFEETRDPRNCTRLLTENFREQSAGDEDPKAALRTCRRGFRNDEPTDSIEFGDVSVDGDTAEVTYTPKGREDDGYSPTVRLRKEGDRWKLDEITEYSIEDRDAFDTALRVFLRRPPDALSAGEANCVIRALGSNSDVERRMVSGKGLFGTKDVEKCTEGD